MNKKIKIASTIKNYSLDEALDDYKKLVEIHPNSNDLNKIIGNKFVDYFMFPYRLNVPCGLKKNITFYEFFKNPYLYLTEKGTTFFNSIISKSIKSGMTKNKAIYDYFRIYICSVASFKPLISKYLYELYKPTTILDFSMGWGGRLVGAMSIPNIKYIGFDTNTDLINPYKKMIDTLNCSNRVKLFFKDSSKEDFSKFNYDMVFTSPPYFKVNKPIENYPNMPEYNNTEDWINKFYKPVMTNAYKHLKSKGAFCINTNADNYNILKIFFGPCKKKINIRNSKPIRSKEDKYKISVSTEYIYIWIKP